LTLSNHTRDSTDFLKLSFIAELPEGVVLVTLSYAVPREKSCFSNLPEELRAMRAATKGLRR
jgi:hypothetical protein